jgi:Predicted membrane protein (DUF2142)
VVALTPSKERTVVLLLCACAAVRVFLFSAAFPFFNNVDEAQHLDLVLKYGHGHWPRGLENLSSETSQYLATYETPEYFTDPQSWGGNYPPPNWKLGSAERAEAEKPEFNWWQTQQNHESGEPPLYYTLAALWRNLGHLFGINAGCSLYWIRFFNIMLAAALVWIGFIAARLVFPERRIIQLGVPALLAVWPQSAFYAIASDVLSPLCFGGAFIGLILFLRSKAPTLRLGLWLGLALSATCLAKTSNLPLLAVAAIIVAGKVVQFVRAGLLRSSWPALLGLGICTIAPLAAWSAWNYHVFGDLLGTAAKIEWLGWTRKPIRDWWSHPIFTLHGVQQFWSELIASFWRGEFVWHGRQRLASPIVDSFYSVSSLLAAAIAFGSLFFSRFRTRLQSEALGLAILSLAALIAFLISLSIAFDFGNCPYPSRENPFFSSGRLISAAAVPFFLLYAYAFDWATRRLPEPVRWLSFGVIIFFIAVSQTVVNWPSFASQFNFFHMCMPGA